MVVCVGIEAYSTLAMVVSVFWGVFEFGMGWERGMVGAQGSSVLEPGGRRVR